jgi:hypothetical protein
MAVRVGTLATSWTCTSMHYFKLLHVPKLTFVLESSSFPPKRNVIIHGQSRKGSFWWKDNLKLTVELL